MSLDGRIDDNGPERLLLSGAEDVWEGIRWRVPMQRFGEPRELAEVIYFLASPAASFNPL